jgi:hypothetical protein
MPIGPSILAPPRVPPLLILCSLDTRPHRSLADPGHHMPFSRISSILLTGHVVTFVPFPLSTILAWPQHPLREPLLGQSFRSGRLSVPLSSASCSAPCEYSHMFLDYDRLKHDAYRSLFGTAIIQAYVYSSTYRQDSLRIKAVVGTVM